MSTPENWSDLSDSFPTLLRPNILYRSADPTYADYTASGSPRTVINLRVEPDAPRWPDVTYVHCPIPNRIEKYDTSQEAVRVWLADVLQAVARAETPVLLHCRFGRDRTGIVVAVLLKVLLDTDDSDGGAGNVAVEEAILADYLKVPGAKRHLMEMTLDGLKTRMKGEAGSWLKSYFRKTVVPVRRLKEMLLRWPAL